MSACRMDGGGMEVVERNGADDWACYPDGLAQPATEALGVIAALANLSRICRWKVGGTTKRYTVHCLSASHDCWTISDYGMDLLRYYVTEAQARACAAILNGEAS